MAGTLAVSKPFACSLAVESVIVSYGTPGRIGKWPEGASPSMSVQDGETYGYHERACRTECWLSESRDSEEFHRRVCG